MTILANGANFVNLSATKTYFVFPNNNKAPVPAILTILPRLRLGGGGGGGLGGGGFGVGVKLLEEKDAVDEPIFLLVVVVVQEEILLILGDVYIVGVVVGGYRCRNLCLCCNNGDDVDVDVGFVAAAENGLIIVDVDDAKEISRLLAPRFIVAIVTVAFFEYIIERTPPPPLVEHIV